MIENAGRVLCRVCGGGDLHSFLDLGGMPLANALLTEEELALPEPRFPLDVSSCARCGLVQLPLVVSPAALFQRYVYFSSVSQFMTRHFAALAREAAARFVAPGGLAVEIGSNDGVLLQALRGEDVRILGVEPATNVAEVARAKGVPTINFFFSEALAQEIRHREGPASLVFAANVLAHMDDVADAARGIEHLLDARGVLVVECPYVVDFIEKKAFDTIYHEHLSCFGVRPLVALFEQVGLEVFDVRRLPVHGGSIRVYVRRHRDGARPAERPVAELAALEDRAGVRARDRLDALAREIRALRDEIRDAILGLRREGKRVAAYTAPAKGNTLLNYCEFTTEEIEYLADATPAKHGLYAPGSHIPILPIEAFHERPPDYALLLAWNHRDEVLAREEVYRRAGGRFLVPIPAVEIV
ncbi:MAG: class I SAM-dependent methyltransferase [Pseudomonadota bacterium]|nr:class I SAM-dependent methyltransferase [Pseudomonadota bacterium]